MVVDAVQEGGHGETLALVFFAADVGEVGLLEELGVAPGEADSFGFGGCEGERRGAFAANELDAELAGGGGHDGVGEVGG